MQMSIARSLGRYLGGAAVLTVAGTSGFAVPALADTADEPRNIIGMIGDGMGFNHVDAANLYEHGTTNWQIEDVPGEQITQQDGYGSTPRSDLRGVRRAHGDVALLAVPSTGPAMRMPPPATSNSSPTSTPRSRPCTPGWRRTPAGM